MKEKVIKVLEELRKLQDIARLDKESEYQQGYLRGLTNAIGTIREEFEDDYRSC